MDGSERGPIAALLGWVWERGWAKRPVKDLYELWMSYGYPDYPRRPGQPRLGSRDRAEMLCRWLRILYDNDLKVAQRAAEELDETFRGQAKTREFFYRASGHIMLRDAVDSHVRQLAQRLPKWHG